ncbi:MAG: 16S rRNA (adenine(1518)-N(6)/adenine(1519)-N(6))-dimethyltransferase RsmA [Acidimicrobiales bacterium]
MTHSPQDLRALMERHGLEARRALGQNFVVDPNTVRRIARLAGVEAGDPVVEIGPGLGSLTLALLERGAEVTAVEMDRDLVPVLREVVEPHGARVIEGDAREVDWDVVLASHRQWTLVANLPYNVATPLVLDLLRDVPRITSMLVMVQREAGERLAASVGDKAIGIPSILVAYHGIAEVVGRVPATVFHPQPKVESVLVRIDRHERPPVSTPLSVIDPILRAAYGQRRKMLRRSLGSLVSDEAFVAAGVDPTARPETLDLGAWARLAAQPR